jgi:hypothetical protein
MTKNYARVILQKKSAHVAEHIFTGRQQGSLCLVGITAFSSSHEFMRDGLCQESFSTIVNGMPKLYLELQILLPNADVLLIDSQLEIPHQTSHWFYFFST